MSRLDLVLINPCSRPQVYQSLGASLTAVENPVWAGLMATFCRLKGLSATQLQQRLPQRPFATPQRDPQRQDRGRGKHDRHR